MPKLYGKKFANRYIEKKLRPRAETRDGIIFEIDWDANMCKCKIQGSDEYVNAYFPRNLETIPHWMKPGNAVRILHRTGIRGHMEVVSSGGAIPTPQPGSPSHPPTVGQQDGVVTGLGMTSAGGLCITIAPGTYIIDETEYSADGNEAGFPIMDESTPEMTMTEIYPPADMGDPAGLNYELMDESNPPWTMSEADPPAILGTSGGTFCVDPIANGWYRYDAFQIGTDGVIDYVKGTASMGNPAYPLIDAGHIQLGHYILVFNYGGESGIYDSNIGQTWSTPTHHGLGLQISGLNEDDQLPWGTPVAPPPMGEIDGDEGWTSCTITVTALNQYGNAVSGTHTFTAQMVVGTGWIHSTESGYQGGDGYEGIPTAHITTGGGSASFTYIRDQSDVPYLLPWGYFECGVCETNPQIFINAASSGMQMENNCIIPLLTVGGNVCSYIGEVHGYTGWTQKEQDESGDVAINWSVDGSNVEIIYTEDGDITLSGGVDGDKLVLLIRQDSTGGWTPTLPANVEYGDQITEANISIATEANSRTYLGFIFDSKTSNYDLVANVSGYGA